MSHLSYMEKLLDGVEVEWIALGGLAENLDSMRKPITSGLRESGAIPYYGASGIVDYVKDYIFDGDFLLVSEDGANLLARNTPIAFSISGKSWVNNHAHVLKFNTYVERRFVDIYLNSIDLTPYISGAAQPKLNQKNLNSIPIPIPCRDNPEKSLAIQAEIVRILDAFTAMTAELTAELNLRKKQYNYYRDQLLSFEEGDVEWKTLGDVTKKWYSGGTPKAGNPEFYEDGNIPWLRTQEVKFADIFDTDVKVTPAALQNSSAKWIPKNCVIIAISGATAGRSAINKIPLTTNQHCGCLEIDDKRALYRYVFHWVSFNYENIKALGQGARGDLNSTIIKNFRLPVPYANDPEKSLLEQARIVAILDKFDTLTTSLQEGLPREIELRRKQYEYYRDLLLSFPKPGEAA
tara:strand:- start:6756 stop:7973 length:1218 start_codon:yes stop_codon:yes gene_type:complete